MLGHHIYFPDEIESDIFVASMLATMVDSQILRNPPRELVLQTYQTRMAAI